MGDYFRHWLRMRKSLKRPPKVFHVNWFRKSAEGKYLWPGYGENMRVLKWIVDRCRGRVPAYETPVGWMPEPEDIDIHGLVDYDPKQLDEALSVNMEEWKREVLGQDDLFFRLYSDLPKELIFQRELLISRL
jgi:phosphoenolpyruvate carboxykinase (GTP)